MVRPELLFVTGCNAAGKSSLIRSHLSEFKDYEVIMTDVYKARSRQVFSDTIRTRKNIILETPFNDEGFKDLIDQANNAGYDTTFIVLFLKSPAQSFERVAARRAFEGGLVISPGNVEHNFIENFKNVSRYFPYFHESYFIYTGERDSNELIMRFEKDKLMEYVSNDLTYVQKFAEQAYRHQRLDKHDLDIIATNKLYKVASIKEEQSKSFRIRR
jgi:predicted ABC-type ATPase